MELLDESPAAIGEAVRTRQVRAAEVVRASLERIDARNGALGAFVAVDHERAMDDAGALDARIDAGDDPGPLAGVPFGVKDLEDATGYVTTYGSALHADDPSADVDSLLVERLRRAGAIVVGKTNTPERGHISETDNSVFGRTANPWDTARSPGGSSGGTAAALATRMVPLATGSDGGGSIRIPAALCGLAGFKPSQGRIPLGPKPPSAATLSTSGPMTRRAVDLPAVLACCVGPDQADPFSLPPPQNRWDTIADGAELPERVLWAPSWGYAIDSGIASVTREAVDRLAAAGTTIIEIDDVFDEDPVIAWYTMWTALMHRTYIDVIDTPAWDEVTPTLRTMIEFGTTVSGAQLGGAFDAIYRLNARLVELFATAPLLLCPTVAGRTPLTGHNGTIDGVEDLMWVRYTYPFNLTRNPAGTVCAGLLEGMPVGLQIIGPHLADAAVLRTMVALEALLGTPELPAVPEA